MTDRELVEVREGKEIYQYADGSLRDAKGYWVARPPGAAPVITSDTAPVLADRKWELYQEAVKEGAIEATGTPCEHGAIVRISSAQASLSLDTDKGHASTKAAEFVFRAAGWLKPKDNGQQGGSVTINLPPGLRLAIGMQTDSVDTGTED